MNAKRIIQSWSQAPAPVANSIVWPVFVVCLAVVSGCLTVLPASASDAAKLEKKGKRAFAQGDYKKAGEEWSRMVVLLQERAERIQARKLAKKQAKRATEAAVGDLETAYRPPGECP